MKTEEFLKICNIEVTKLDRKIVIDQSRLIALLDKHKEAINYTHSCKSDSEQLLDFGKELLPRKQHFMLDKHIALFLKERSK